jgi:uncharacterized membrane protein YraQ (UPF0718 family)
VPLTEVIPWVVTQVATSIIHNWPFLALGILGAAALKVYVGTERIADLFQRRTGYAVVASVAAAVGTPFCSCGTTAVILSLIATTATWAPVVAFMVASPLTSPTELIVSTGLFGLPFGIFFFGSSIVLGLAGGGIAYLAQRAGLLENQARFVAQPACACEGPVVSAPIALGVGSRDTVSAPTALGVGPGVSAPIALKLGPAVSAQIALGVGPGAAAVAEFELRRDRVRFRQLAGEIASMGGRMLALFVGFAAIGYAVIAIIPTEWLTTMLGGSNPISVIVAATLGIPFYVSSEASLPLVRGLMDGGMGTGPAMAFLITGAGTSVGAITGGLLIARWRVLAIVVGTLWLGAIVLGLIAGMAL